MNLKAKQDMLVRVLSEHNPFALQMGKDNIRLANYEKSSDCYKEVLLLMWSMFPRGFIDMPLFMTTWMGVSLAEAERICGVKQYCSLRIWEVGDKERNNMLRSVLQMFIKYTGCSWDENAFQQALYDFDVFLINSNVKEKTNNGIIVHFVNQ